MSLSGPRDISFQNPTDNAKDTTTDTIGFKEDGNAIDRPQEREAKSDDISGVGETDSFQDEVGINRNNERHDSEEGLDRKEVVPDRDIEAPITEVKGLRLSESVHEPPLDSQSTVSPDLAHGCSGSVQEKERSPTPPPPPPKDAIYLDPTPKTPRPSAPPSRTPSHTGLSSQDPEKADVFQDGQSKITSGASSDVEFDEKRSMAHGRDGDADSRSEIQSIMDQFDEAGGGPGIEEVMSPRLELAGPLLGSPVQHPPRKSSLEPVKTENKTALHDSSSSPLLQSPLPEGTASFQRVVSRSMSPETSSLRRLSLLQPLEIKPSGSDTPVSPNPPSSLHKPPPPEPDPEPELPFDFHRFLEQLRHRTADPVAKFLRSFLSEFGKKQWMVHEQVKIISDFLAFITNKMAQCEVWQGVSDAEFDNAREGMEKLVMNRLYGQTFSPAIPPPAPLPGTKGKRKNMEKLFGPGRRGQHQEDIERDEILAQKVRIYGWVREEHLDIPPVGESGRRFLGLAQQGL